MIGSAPSALSIAVDHAKHGRRVALCCPPDQNGACRFPECGKRDDQHQLVPHAPKEVGKAPIGRFFPMGINDATTNTAKLDAFLRQMPDANVSVDLESTGWLIVDTDSPEAEAAELAHGLDGAVIRESRNRAYVFLRPADCPIVNLIKSEGDALDILTTGNFLVHGTHASGAPIRLDPNAKPGPAPARYGELLKAKASEKKAQEDATAARRAERAAQYGNGPEPPVRLHQRGQRRWSGELVQTKDGSIDRSDSLYFLGLDLAECNASEGAIVAALVERDAAFGWNTYTDRKNDREYERIAEKVVAYVVGKQKEPQLTISAPADVPDDLAALRAALEAAQARVTFLERALMDRDDRLEVVEPIVAMIDEIIARPEIEREPDEKDENGRIVKKGKIIGYGPTADDKLVAITLARWLPAYRARQEAKDREPTVSLEYLSKVMGMPSRRISKSLDRLSSDDPNDGAAFQKVRHPVRHWADEAKTIPVINPKTGKQLITTPIEVRPWRATVAESLRAAATCQMPERPQHGGSKEASEARWGRCDKHDNREVRVKGFCPDCGRVIGERMMALQEFDALNVQVGHSEGTAPTVSSSNPRDVQLGHSDHAHGPVERLKVQPVDSAQPLNLLDYAASRPQEPPPRCPAPGCTALGFRRLPDGSYRCLKSRHDPRAYELVPLAVRGASE